MKLIILLFLIALYPATLAQMSEEEDIMNEENQEVGMPGGWTNIDLDEVNSSQEILAICNFGADFVAQKAVESKDAPNFPYDISEILSVEQQVVSGMNYRVHCKIVNAEGTTIDANFVVWNQPWTGTMKVTSWSYNLRTKDSECWDDDPNDIDYSDDNNEEEVNEFTVEEWLNEEESASSPIFGVIDLDELDSNEGIQHALDWGAAELIKEGVEEGKIPDTTFNIVEVYRIWMREVNGIKYKFHVMLDNGQGVTVKAIFTVLTKDWEDYKLLTCFKYSVLKVLKEETDTESDGADSIDDSTNEEVIVEEEHSQVEKINEEENCNCPEDQMGSEEDDTIY